MNLDEYLDRIGFAGKPEPDFSTLESLMRAHLAAVPFENLDQQLGVPVSTDVQAAFDKIVRRKRGGWCFEVNALFGWALSEIGFQIQTLAGHVGRDETAGSSTADHMCLLVDCSERYLVDVGFGGSLIEPLSLASKRMAQPPYTVGITQAAGEYHRFTEQADGKTSSFDFPLTPVGSNYFDAISQHLQTNENSPFKRTLTVQQRHATSHVVLRGRVLRRIGTGGSRESVLNSGRELADCIDSEFGLYIPEIASVWPKIEERHVELFGATNTMTKIDVAAIHTAIEGEK